MLGCLVRRLLHKLYGDVDWPKRLNIMFPTFTATNAFDAIRLNNGVSGPRHTF